LPDDAKASIEETCAPLLQRGFNPVPHLTARNFVDRADLDQHLSRLSAVAGVTRALVIAGDVDTPRGEFRSSLDLMRTGLLERHGIRSILLAGHPEGHPAVEDGELDAALMEKIAYARSHQLVAEIVTQFCFEADPIISWLRRIRGLGIDAPVRVGLAGPANPATLLKFAMRCGIGNSLRALRRRSNIAKLLGDVAPDEVLEQVAARAEGLGPISGIHLYMFGGMRKTSSWLTRARYQAQAINPPQAVSGSTGS
jgi:methylenetetrahydrofolate reductase (NADPH)